VPDSVPEEKPKRFRLVKLEERIAPGKRRTVGCPTATTCGACNGTGGGLSLE
jgi:hypothetical protein